MFLEQTIRSKDTKKENGRMRKVFHENNSKTELG